MWLSDVVDYTEIMVDYSRLIRLDRVVVMFTDAVSHHSKSLMIHLTSFF